MPYATNGDTRLFYEVHGKEGAPALVFAHGRGGNAASWWQQVPVFAARYRVVTFDHRAFGRSTCPPGEFHIRHFPGDICAILDDAGIDRAAMVCQSMGGNTGLWTAVQQPDRVGALVLACTPGGVMTDAVRERRARRAANIEGERERFGNLALAPDYPQRAPEMAYLYDQVRAFNTGEGPDARARMAGPDAELDLTGLVGYAVPTLIVAGEHDQLYPPEVLQEVATVIPGCEIAGMEGVGHSAYWEDAATFNVIVGAFLDRHWPGDA